MSGDNGYESDIAPDPKGNIELVRYGDTALLFRGTEHQPFVVAPGYDRSTGEWSGSGRYFDDLAEACDAANPSIVEDATVRFSRDDIGENLEKVGIEASDYNISTVLKSNRIETSPEGLHDAAWLGGMDYVDAAIKDLSSPLVHELDLPEGYRYPEEQSLDSILSDKESEASLDDIMADLDFGQGHGEDR